MRTPLIVLMALAIILSGSVLIAEDADGAPETYTGEQRSTTYVLSFDANGGSGAPNALETTAAASSCRFIIPGQEPTRPSYTFLGWATSPGNETPESWYQPGDYITLYEDSPTRTLYAKWSYTPTTDYIVYYDANGGSGGPGTVSSGPVSSQYYTVEIPDQIPTRTGFEFMGWARSSTATSATYQPGDTFRMVPTGSSTVTTTLYAVWSSEPDRFILQFNANGGSGGPGTMRAGDDKDYHNFTIPYTEPTRSGYTFLGWATSSGASHAQYDPGDTYTADPGTNTLYAVWSQILNDFTLIFTAHAGSDEVTGMPETMTGQSAQATYTFTIPNTIPQREDYEFVEWRDSTSDFGYTAYDPGDDITVNVGTSQLYAIWDRTAPIYEYTISYHENGAPGGQIDATRYGPTEDTSHTLVVTSSVPTWAGYDFIGWNTAANGSGTDYEAGDEITLTSANTTITLYAQWAEIEEFTLTFDDNGGNNGPGILRYQSSTDTSHDFTIPQTVPTRTDYTFLGWGRSEQDDTPEAWYHPGDTYTCTQQSPHGTLYAQWAYTPPTTYIVYFNANAGDDSVTGMPSTINSGVLSVQYYTVEIPDTTPQREGFQFLGWADTSTASTGTWQPGESFRLVPDGDSTVTTTLYAIWTSSSDRFILQFDANGGSGAPSALTAADDGDMHTFTIPMDEPTRPGWTFDGWDEVSSAQHGSYQPGQTYTAHPGTTTLYAIWTEDLNDFTLIFTPHAGSDEVTGMPETMTAQSAQATYTFTIPDSIPQREGYYFQEWRDSLSILGYTSYDPGDDITVNSGTSQLYAIWGTTPPSGSPQTIRISGPGDVAVGDTGTIYATVLPSTAGNRAATWSVTSGSDLIEYTTTETYNGGRLDFTAKGAGTVTILAMSSEDSSVRAVYTLTIMAERETTTDTVQINSIVQAIADQLFGGNTAIAGVIVFTVTILAIFLLIREPLPVLLIMMPVTLIYRLLDILTTDVTILLIIVSVVGLALIARNMWRDRRAGRGN